MPQVRRSYQQYCPLARSLDVVGERWTLLIVRELMIGPLRFSDLRAHLPGCAPTLLTQRLRDLEDAGLVERAELPPPAARTVYTLTPRGRELEPVIYEFARFGQSYLGLPTEEEPVPMHLLPLGLKTMVVVEALPRRPFVVHLAYEEGEHTMRIASPDHVPAISRVTVERGAPERADAVVRGSVAGALLVKEGVVSLEDAVTQGLLTVEGSPRNVDAAVAMFGFR